MSIREIPRAWEYTCDKCGSTHLQENASGQYSNSTPPKWMSLKIGVYSKSPVDILLCDQCKEILVELHIPGITG